jgi:hypothetical protein
MDSHALGAQPSEIRAISAGTLAAGGGRTLIPTQGGATKKGATKKGAPAWI